MQSSTKPPPANDTRPQRHLPGDHYSYNPDLAEDERQARDVGDAVSQVDALIERGVFTDGQRANAERVLFAFIQAGSPDGTDEQALLVNRVLRVAAKRNPQELIHQRREAVLQALEPHLKATDALDTELAFVEIKLALKHVGAPAKLTSEIFERTRHADLHHWAANISVALGAFGDGDVDKSRVKFADARRAYRKLHPPPR